MDEVVTSRFPEELLKKMDKAVSRGVFRSRSEALRAMVEEHLREHPALFLGDGAQDLLANSPALSDDELEALGETIFGGMSGAELGAEGRSRR